MQRQSKLFLITLLLSVIIASIDYFLFLINPGIWFYIYNVFAFIMGIGFVIISYILIRLKTEYELLHYFTFLVGVAMIIVHAVKIIYGNCI